MASTAARTAVIAGLGVASIGAATFLIYLATGDEPAPAPPVAAAEPVPAPPAAPTAPRPPADADVDDLDAIDDDDADAAAARRQQDLVDRLAAADLLEMLDPDDATPSTGFGRPGHGPGARPPSVTTAPTGAIGTLDRADIRRVMQRHLVPIRNCYERQLAVTADLAGTVRARFTVGKDGRVLDASASGMGPAVDDCVAGVIRRITFPAPRGGGIVTVTYPFTFRSA